MIKLIEKIEGEAKLNFSFQEGRIDDVQVDFMSSRGIEEILKGKSPLDALVINPRVCGICGHAHLIATVQALESCYEDIKISKKAKIIRELTLNFEIIQNHFKWFYLTIFPLFGLKQEIMKALHPSQLMGKAIALFGGQYPHTSYAIVGGVACEITNMDIIKLQRYIDETIGFFEKNVANADIQTLQKLENTADIMTKQGDLPDILRTIEKNGWQKLGKSYDRFIAFGENSCFAKGKLLNARIYRNVFVEDVRESDSTTSFAKSVHYLDRYYEVGPLARAMIKKNPLIKDAHGRYEDSMFTRILARVYEIAGLLTHSRSLIEELDLSEPSYIKPDIDISQLNSSGSSAVEAARGTLIHKVEIENSVIKNYEIITPTQWNLCGGDNKNRGVSQKAMIGLNNTDIAELVFKTFDVCSVCTTH
ncbi:nickel-dependent hydrogenase large subunit [Sulfurimonas sp. HSL-1716]|uniref:nickel-dependent hydrogenase large subunit n=1 Tax=Hydrocurvibacter sulfurireducens TaxID=3131937 RepID=UPI0031F9EE58